MFNYDDLDVQQEIGQIPPEYQDVFRQALDRELADQEQDQTETDILHYLRRRRDDFRRGAFIRPDGRPGIVTADPETLYEQGILGVSTAGEDEEAARERRLTRLKVAGLLLLAALFLFFAFRGRAANTAEEKEGTETATVVAAEVTATPALPDVTGAGDALQTIGALGAALTIGRPSALELHYNRTEETIALAIDPSQTTPRGELRYNPATMSSENPVAVWLFGTVVNYGIGLPASLVRNLQPGDRISLSTDTGATLSFVVTATRQGSSHETAEVLSQNRPGMTLFALPAVAEDDVALALAAYDVATEEQGRTAVYEIGDEVLLPGWGARVEAVTFEHTHQGLFRIVVKGANKSKQHETSGELMLSLTASGDQTPAVPVQAGDDGTWQATFSLAGGGAGLPLYAELRSLPGGELAVVQLGEIPDLLERLELSGLQAQLSDEARQVQLQFTVHNPGEGAVYLGPEFVSLQGGEAHESAGQVLPSLPTLLAPGETLGMRFVFPLTAAGAPGAGEPNAWTTNGFRQSIQVKVGADLYEVGQPVGD